jgi:hypothetical protein
MASERDAAIPRARSPGFGLAVARRAIANGDLETADNALCAALAEVRKRKAREDDGCS